MDNIPTYCDCKHGKKTPDYLHPELTSVLCETYGVIIYQEQVMEIARILAGYSLGQADILRRAMGKKIKKEMDQQRKIFIDGAVANKINENQARKIFELVAKFADYGFNKSHAAAYALIAYQTAYLKANYPAEFLSALMTHEMSNTEKLSDLCQEAKKLGIRVASPSINHSYVDFVSEDNVIYYALSAIKSVGSKAVEHLVEARTRHGPFKNLSDFILQIEAHFINRRALESMAAAGVFDELFSDRREIFENAGEILSMASTRTMNREQGQNDLFQNDGYPDIVSQNLNDSVSVWSLTERLKYEFEAIGFFLSEHPLDDYIDIFDHLYPKIKSCSVFFSEVEKGHTAGRLAGVVIQCQERRSRSGTRFAFLSLSDPTGHYVVSIFSDVLAESRNFLTPGTKIIIMVEVGSRGTDTRLIARKIELIDEVMKKIPEMKMCITLKHEVPFEGLENLFLKSETKRIRGQIRFIIQVRYHSHQMMAVIKIPDCYEVDLGLIKKVKTLPYVERIEITRS
ncbi:MAG: DNA polymerase III subunit alpha, partial [Alphaproteobacteria bacterium]|nr:DNA polymerase III subunit alpha [Alphaproteobacteria bacterium]